MKIELLLAAALATGLTLAAERGPHNRDDYVPGTYTNARARAANSIKYAHAPNRLLEKIVKGELAKGGYIALADPQVAEAAGMSGLDFVWIDAEHRPFTVKDILMADIALKGTGCASLVRVRTEEFNYLKQLLDTGIDGIIVPQVNTYEQAKRAIAACRYPQAGGERGICVDRQSGYGKTPLFDYLKRSETFPFIVIEIEHADALKDLDRILTLDFDAVMVGPADLSCSLGGLKDAGTPKVKAIVTDIARRTHAAGKLFFALGMESAKANGGDLVCGPGDLESMTVAWRAFVR